MPPAIVIHGGCGSSEEGSKLRKKYYEQQALALSKIIKKAWEFLSSGNSAIDSAEKAVYLLENSPHFNAGIGAVIGSNKQIELDASIMDGRNLNVGALGAIQNFPNPISIARHLLDDQKVPHVLLTGEGAKAYALSEGFKTIPSEKFYTEYQLQCWEEIKNSKYPQAHKGTVGAVVMDAEGNLAAATSTGGTVYKLPGRLGDTPIIGAGTYAANGIGAASATGYGEQIIRAVLAKTALDLSVQKSLSPATAAKQAIQGMSGMKNGIGGLIIIDAQGNIGAHSNDGYFPCAYMCPRIKEPVVSRKCHFEV